MVTKNHLKKFKEIYDFFYGNGLLSDLILIYNENESDKLLSLCLGDKVEHINLGSLSKILTSIILLETFKNNNLEKIKISDYIDTNNNEVNEVTIHSLLNHTSGIMLETKGMDFKIAYEEFAIENDTIISNLALPEDNESEKYSYSNVGFAILTLILETHYKKSFIEILNSRFGDLIIFNPIYINGKPCTNCFMGSGGLTTDIDGMKNLIYFLNTTSVSLQSLGMAYSDDLSSASGRVLESQSSLYISKRKNLFAFSNSDFIPDDFFLNFFRDLDYEYSNTTLFLDKLSLMKTHYKEISTGNKIQIIEKDSFFYFITAKGFRFRIIELNETLWIPALRGCCMKISSINKFEIFQDEHVVETYLLDE